MLDRFERFSYTLSELSRYWHKIAGDEMSHYGLKGPHCVYILTLYRNPEGVTATQLSALCGKDKADVSRSLTVMEEKGLVRKGHGYRTPMHLTAYGKQAAEQVEQRAVTAVELGGKGLSDEARQIFYSTMDRIAENLRILCEDGLPQK